MTTEFQESIFETSHDYYDNLFERFLNNCKFRDKTIQEWKDTLGLKELREDFTFAELEEYNKDIMYQTHIISENYALASANNVGLKKSAERALAIAQQKILDDLEKENALVANPASKRRAPSKDKLEIEAYNMTKDLQTAAAVAEMFNEFWSLQYKRVNLLNSRLTSLSVMKNAEVKLQE